MSLGENIYKLRMAKHLSQGELAEQLQVSRQSISKWENNSAVPSLDTLMKLSDIFGISLDELVKGADRKEESQYEGKNENISKKQAGCPPRKIAGTILLCMAFLVILFFLFAGGGLAGLIFASPFLLCGITCFLFKRNIGLWCSWVTYLCVDAYLRFATGINWSVVRLSFRWTQEMNYVRLAIGWVQFLAMLLLIFVTVRRFKDSQIPTDKKSRSKMIVLWAAFAVIHAVIAIYPRLWMNYLAYVVSIGMARTIMDTILDWCRILIFTWALCYTIRYIRSKRSRAIPDFP